MNLAQEIAKLKREREAVLLVHNYQRSEIHELADCLGDSLGLARYAAQTDTKTIVFCGVTFMAETAKILSPAKTVLIPQKEARCPMAEMVDLRELDALKARHPDAAVVCYINTYAEVKARADVCVTSANAVKVIQSLSARRIIFVPDRNLAAYCQRFTDKEIIPWDGYCYVHARITKDEVLQARKAVPDAVLIVHPECPPDVIDCADEVLSTEGMVKYARQSDKQRFLIGTEEGLIARLKRENPEKTFFAAGTARICTQMKLTTLRDVYLSLAEYRYVVEVQEETADRARKSLERMLEYV
jgi:quinolinate synthase